MNIYIYLCIKGKLGASFCFSWKPLLRYARNHGQVISGSGV